MSDFPIGGGKKFESFQKKSVRFVVFICVLFARCFLCWVFQGPMLHPPCCVKALGCEAGLIVFLFLLSRTEILGVFFLLSMPFPHPLTFHCVCKVPTVWGGLCGETPLVETSEGHPPGRRPVRRDPSGHPADCDDIVEVDLGVLPFRVLEFPRQQRAGLNGNRRNLLGSWGGRPPPSWSAEGGVDHPLHPPTLSHFFPGVPIFTSKRSFGFEGTFLVCFHHTWNRPHIPGSGRPAPTRAGSRSCTGTCGRWGGGTSAGTACVCQPGRASPPSFA